MEEPPRRPTSKGFPAVKPCVVTIITKTGAKHVFPDMDKNQIFRLLGTQLYSAGDLTLVNVSGTCLVIATRIIETIELDGEVSWKAPEQSPVR
jgi:hypothetical protein